MNTLILQIDVLSIIKKFIQTFMYYIVKCYTFLSHQFVSIL